MEIKNDTMEEGEMKKKKKSMIILIVWFRN